MPSISSVFLSALKAGRLGPKNHNLAIDGDIGTGLFHKPVIDGRFTTAIRGLSLSLNWLVPRARVQECRRGLERLRSNNLFRRPDVGVGEIFPEQHIDDVLCGQAFIQVAVRFFLAVFGDPPPSILFFQEVGDLVDEVVIGIEKDHFILGEQLV